MQACGFLISIHALRVEGDGERHAGYNIKPEISIHALRVEGDAEPQTQKVVLKISIHALRVEGDCIRGG